MRIISARCTRPTVLTTIVALAWCLVLPGAGRAQTSEQQVVNDAAQALGGRDRIASVMTMVLEGAGNQVAGTSLRYDDLGYASAINQLRDLKRAYDLATGRARFDATSMAEYAYYIGNAPTRQIQGLDGTIAFNLAANSMATRVFGNQANARRIEYLRHPVTLVRAALGSDAKLSHSRTQGVERLVDITVGDLQPLTLAIDATTKLPTRIIQMTDSATMGDTAVALAFGDYRPVSGLQLPMRLTT